MEIKTTNNYTVRSLGKQKRTVYDIEVEDNHNFFANNILVHNSIYLDMYEFVKRFDKGNSKSTDDIVDMLDKAGKHVIEPIIEKGYAELREYMNSFQQQMFMDREGISSCGFFVAKKRYALLVHNNEGVQYSEPKLKIMGLETARSSTPEFIRDELNTCIKTMLTEGETATQDKIKTFHKKYSLVPPESLAFPRGVAGIQKYSDGNGWFNKGTPKHVKAAIHHNRLVDELGLNIPHINDGDKIKFISITVPNPKGIDVIGWNVNNKLPEEFDLHKYINYSEMYSKSFFSPISAMMDVCGWDAEKKNTLDALFG